MTTTPPLDTANISIASISDFNDKLAKLSRILACTLLCQVRNWLNYIPPRLTYETVNEDFLNLRPACIMTPLHLGFVLHPTLLVSVKVVSEKQKWEIHATSLSSDSSKRRDYSAARLVDTFIDLY